MGQTTSIAWTDHTFNIVWGCTQISPACAHCYAKTLSERWGFDVWGENAERRVFGDKHWNEPLKWDRQAEQEGRRHRVFCSSMADVFEDHPTVDQERLKLWPLIRQTPWLYWQLLTKRPENIAANLPADWGNGYSNVWLGTTIENQEFAERRLPQLLDIPAIIHFASGEPLLDSINLEPWLCSCPVRCEMDSGQMTCSVDGYLDWLIVGGESGPRHRPLNLSAVRSLRDQCQSSATPFFFKQHGGRTPDAGGCLLDGREWKEFPQSA
jgi:protein gp37